MIKKFFPARPSVQGFTESLAKKVKERLVNDRFKEVREVEQQVKMHLEEKVEQPTITILRPRVGIGHWANRGFEEYKRAA